MRSFFLFCLVLPGLTSLLGAYARPVVPRLSQHHVDAISLNAKLERRNMTTWAPQHPQAQPVIQPHYGHYPSSYPQHPSAHPGILPPPGGYYYGPHTGYYNPSSHPHQPAAQPVIPPEFHGHHIGHSSHQAGHDSSSRPVPLWLTSGTWPTSRIAGYLSDLEENPDPPAWYKEWFIAPSLRNPAVPAVHPMPPWVYQHPPWTFDRIAFKLQELKRRAATELPPQWYLAYFRSIHSQPFYGNVGYHQHPSAYSNPYWPSITYQPSHGNMENDQPPPPYSPAHEMPVSSSISDVGHSHAATLAPPGYEARDAMTPSLLFSEDHPRAAMLAPPSSSSRPLSALDLQSLSNLEDVHSSPSGNHNQAARHP